MTIPSLLTRNDRRKKKKKRLAPSSGPGKSEATIPAPLGFNLVYYYYWIQRKSFVSHPPSPSPPFSFCVYHTFCQGDQSIRIRLAIYPPRRESREPCTDDVGKAGNVHGFMPHGLGAWHPMVLQWSAINRLVCFG